MSDRRIDLLQHLGRACTLLATPSSLSSKELQIAHTYARRLGNACIYFATNPVSQTEGLAGSIVAELTILNHILEPSSKPKRGKGRPVIKHLNYYEALFVLPVYNGFKGSRPKAVRYLVDQGLLVLGKDDTIGKWVKHFKDINERIRQKFALLSVSRQ
jgi:hypothetical protein